MLDPTVKNIAGYLNRTLRVGRIKDASLNGLQVSSRKSGAIGTVGFAVDACMTTFERAKKLGVDLLVVHHGIRWKRQRDRALVRTREAFLKKIDMALYAVHLPLDLHEKYGNNIQLAAFLGLASPRKFGRYHGVKIGYAGKLRRAQRLQAISAVLSKHRLTACRVLPFGKDRIRTIGIVSGGGGSMLPDAVQEGIDCFLVGEVDLALYNAARDQNITVIACGHYATETVGVRALMSVVSNAFPVKTVFVDDVKDL